MLAFLPHRSLLHFALALSMFLTGTNVPETGSTLEFGQNARQVELGKATMHVTRHAVQSFIKEFMNTVQVMT